LNRPRRLSTTVEFRPIIPRPTLACQPKRWDNFCFVRQWRLIAQHYDVAARLLADAARADPQAWDTQFFLGICLLILGHPKDAVGPLNTASAHEPSPTAAQSAHFYLAKAYVQLADLPMAETELRKAAAMTGAPGMGEIRGKATSMLSQVQALRALEKAIRLPE